MSEAGLTLREQRILEAIVRNYITSAEPTGSRLLSKQTSLGLSPASIRNIMGDLEEQGYIAQPHTSAGRVPTDQGYRYYVDRMMAQDVLPVQEQDRIRSIISDADPTDLHVLMEATSTALSRVSQQLGVALAPRLSRGRFRHVHIFEVETHRYLLHLTIDSGFVKTMTVEFATQIDSSRLERACEIINRRFIGKLLTDLSDTDDEFYSGLDQVDVGVVRLFIPSIVKMTGDAAGRDSVFVDGETNMLFKPEFFDRDRLGAVIEILGEKTLLLHVIETGDIDYGTVVVSIGGENKQGVFESFSVVKAKFRVGNLDGSLGVIGPKRMPYPYLVSAVNYTAKLLGEIH